MLNQLSTTAWGRMGTHGAADVSIHVCWGRDCDTYRRWGWVAPVAGLDSMDKRQSLANPGLELWFLCRLVPSQWLYPMQTRAVMAHTAVHLSVRKLVFEARCSNWRKFTALLTSNC
jgi:hypothetical protein